MSNVHQVVLNLPESPADAFPDPDKAPVEIDGLPLDYVKSVTVKAGIGGRTTVTVEFYAEVTGKVRVGEECLIREEQE